MNVLNFDPYAALAEIENGAGLRANRAKRANPRPILAPLARLALSPTPKPKIHPPAIPPTEVGAWREALAWLDAETPLQGFTPERWRQLLEDARWLANRHGDIAAGLGWSASDLFGLDLVLDGWGGLADRLQGERIVTLSAATAHWQGNDLHGWLWRETLTPMKAIWDLA